MEASLVIPFFLMILLAFFSFFSQYASAAELKVQAAAEAKKTGIALGSFGEMDSGDITIFKSEEIEDLWIQPFNKKHIVTESAVCRAWIGFTELAVNETYVYVTPDGDVYHLFADCTHLDLSIQRVTLIKAVSAKNEYGEKYSRCELCSEPSSTMVYITLEGNRYHSSRSCSGLKRTVRQVPISQVDGRRRCIRCSTREE